MGGPIWSPKTRKSQKEWKYKRFWRRISGSGDVKSPQGNFLGPQGSPKGFSKNDQNGTQNDQETSSYIAKRANVKSYQVLLEFHFQSRTQKQRVSCKFLRHFEPDGISPLSGRGRPERGRLKKFPGGHIRVRRRRGPSREFSGTPKGDSRTRFGPTQKC